MSELKPCPFCGADGDDIEYRLICSGIIQNFMLLRCRKCNAILLDMNDSHCPNDLKQKWNTRVISTTIQPSAQPEIIRCRNCKFASGDSRICMKFGHSPIGELDFCAWAERRTDG